jgi:DNA damage-binding protein 1
MMILSCETNSDGSLEVITKMHGNFKETIPRNSVTHMLTVVDLPNQLIAVKCYDGLLKILDMSTDSKQLNLSTIRMTDLNVIDLAFLQGYTRPTVALICKEPNYKILLKVYELELESNKELSNLLWKKDINDNHAFLISVPSPHTGVILVGSQAISYFNPNYEPVQKSPNFLTVSK